MKILISIVAVLVFASCATKESGFFNSYEGMKKIDNNLYFSQADDANLSAYNKIYIPEIKLMVKSRTASPSQHKLNVEVKAYATTAYRKIISKSSSNYELVGIGQKGTLVMQIALSLAQVDKSKKGIDAISFMPFNSEQTQEKLHLVVEVETIDAMSLKPLARSVRVIMDEDIDVKELSFKDLQASLDSWLSTVIKH